MHRGSGCGGRGCSDSSASAIEDVLSALASGLPTRRAAPSTGSSRRRARIRGILPEPNHEGKHAGVYTCIVDSVHPNNRGIFAEIDAASCVQLPPAARNRRAARSHASVRSCTSTRPRHARTSRAPLIEHSIRWCVGFRGWLQLARPHWSPRAPVSNYRDQRVERFCPDSAVPSDRRPTSIAAAARRAAGSVRTRGTALS